MKILLTATVQSHIVQFHRPLAELLHAHGCEVHVAARDNLAEKNGLKLDFADRVFDVPFARSPKSPDNLKAYRELKRIIDEGGYDIVHCNTPMGGVVTRLAAKAARKRGTKVFYTAHGFHFYEGAPKKNWLFFYPVEKYFANHYTDKLITITAEDYVFSSERFQCKTARIHGVGVDEHRYFPADEAERLRLRREYGYTQEQKLILNIGELLPNKNQKTAVRMMRELVSSFPDAVLLIAGNGSEKENLQRQINELGLQDRVKLLGYVTNLQDYQHMVDAVVTCSYREGLPLNVVESMLSGTPVVASLNRGHRELLRDGETGYLVPPDDAAAYAARLTELLTDKERASRLRERASEYAKSYTFTEIKKELASVYGLI